jgi:hypothetical protein
MNDNKTRSILQRVPVILAVTAASYGLPANGQSAARAAAPAGKSPCSATAYPARARRESRAHH